MSRASGAGAYSHGIAWPSPEPPARRRAVARRDEARFSCRWPCSPLWHPVGVMPPRPYHLGHADRPRRCARPVVLRLRCVTRRSPRRRSGRRLRRVGRTPRGRSPAVGRRRGRRWPRRRRSPLTEVAVAERDGRIWVAGGLRTDGTASDEVFVFDPAAGTWTSGPKLPEAVHHASLVSTPAGCCWSAAMSATR